MRRSKTSRNVFAKKHTTFPVCGVYRQVFGNMSDKGIMQIYGREKNGKTTGALLLADYFSSFTKVLYVSGEEGLELEFVDSMRRAGIKENTPIDWEEYISLDEIVEKAHKRNGPHMVFIDNTTVYDHELKKGGFNRFREAMRDKYVVFVSHEKRNEPFPACAEAIKRLAKIYIQVKGLTLFVGGRCPGGVLTIDEKSAQLFHGSEIITN